MQEIKIKVIREPDDDGLFEFEISLSNGDTSTNLEIWGYSDDFKEFGKKLIEFPKGLKDVVSFQLGEEGTTGDMKWAYYLSLNAFCYNASGQSAIKVIIDNHQASPDHSRSEFYIKAEPAAINRLGHELKNWNPESIKEIGWTPN
ncbi:MAG: hypothetical protein K8H85_03950 [Cyclobacteriaceae bacterium]|nr:hypothetical protein [Cyclobacteriaceae bacterium]